MNKFWVYIGLVFIFTLPVISLFLNQNLPIQHDSRVHIARIAAFYEAIMDGQFPVRWAEGLNFKHGLPLFDFIYPLPYFISSLFIFLGFNLVTSFKISISLSFILSGIFMYMFSYEMSKDKKKALLITILYQFVPFRLIEIITRGSFGESYTYTFLPLTLYGIVKLHKKFNISNFSICAFAVSLLVLSHNSISLVFFGIILLFLIWILKNDAKQMWISFMSLITGLALSSFYWLPALLDHKYTYGDLLLRNLYLEHFPKFSYFFIPNFLNSENYQVKGISVQFGLFHVIVLIISLVLIIHKKIEDIYVKKLLTFGLFLVGISLFFMHPISGFIWERLSLLRQFQFPWRFLSVVSFATSLLGISLFHVKLFKKKWIFTVLLFGIVGSTIFYWYPQKGFEKIDENYYWNFPYNTTYFGEFDTVWSDTPHNKYPKSPVEVVDGKALVRDYYRRSNFHTYFLYVKKDAIVVDHTTYFPGWKVYLNGKNTDIQFQDHNWRGQITYKIPKGNYYVKVVFEETKLRLIADFVSLATFLLLIFIMLKGFKLIRNIK